MKARNRGRAERIVVLASFLLAFASFAHAEQKKMTVTQFEMLLESNAGKSDSSVADNEFHIRMLQRYTPVFVPNVTCEFRDHQRTSLGKNNDLAAGLREVYEVHHPYPGRAVLADLRRQTLENVARRPPGQSPFSPTIRIGPPAQA